MSKQVNTLNDVLKVMAQVYLRYAESLESQGNNSEGCKALAYRFAYKTQETYEHMSFVEGKLIKAIKTNHNSVVRLSEKLADEPNRYLTKIHAEQVLMGKLLAQSKQVLDDWFNANEPIETDFMALGIPEHAVTLSVQPEAPAGTPRSDYEDADDNGPLFNR